MGVFFLVSLREVYVSEKMLLLQSMVKEDIDIWEDEAGVFHSQDCEILDGF